DPSGAMAGFDRAVQLDPRNTRALVWKGMVQTNLNRTADALATFERAARTDPPNVDAWIGIANAQMNRRDLASAAAARQNAPRLQSDRPVVKAPADRLRSLQSSGSQPDRRHP